MSTRKEAKEERGTPPAPQLSPQTAATPVKSRSAKAGRNLPAAIGVGVGFGVLLVLGLMYQPIFVALAAAAAGLGAWEIGHGAQYSPRLRHPGIPAGCPVRRNCGGVLPVRFYRAGHRPGGELLALLLSSALVRADRQVSLGKSLSGSALALLWVPLMLGIAMVYFQTDHGERGILMILLMAICNDTFGFIAGVNWGKHPMAPKISPKKSWEGLAGSFVGSAVVGAIALAVMGSPWYWAIPLAAVMVVASTAGDLVESVSTPNGCEDMSNILPGHGGMMDRLDSILFAAAAGCLIFRFIMPL